MSGRDKNPGKRDFYRTVDIITAVLLGLELLSILLGLPRFLRSWQSELFRRSCWVALTNPLLTLLLMVGMPAIAVLAVCNGWALFRKARLPRRCLYRRTNAMVLQLLFFPLTLFCYYNTFWFISVH